MLVQSQVVKKPACRLANLAQLFIGVTERATERVTERVTERATERANDPPLLIALALAITGFR